MQRNDVNCNNENINNEEVTRLEKANPQYFCPITQDIMHLPLSASDEHTYEAEAILKWAVQTNTSPMTREILSRQFKFNTQMFSEIQNKLNKNHSLKKAVKEVQALIKKYSSNNCRFELINSQPARIIAANNANVLPQQHVIQIRDLHRSESGANLLDGTNDEPHYNVRYVVLMGFFIGLLHFVLYPDSRAFNEEEQKDWQQFIMPEVPIAAALGLMVSLLTCCFKYSSTPLLACTFMALLNAGLAVFTPIHNGLIPLASISTTALGTVGMNHVMKCLHRQGFFQNTQEDERDQNEQRALIVRLNQP